MDDAWTASVAREVGASGGAATVAADEDLAVGVAGILEVGRGKWHWLDRPGVVAVAAAMWRMRGRDRL